ncbi:MAG TPA: TonB C-terminal domain-containing protein [Allosphingosinicella sp.]
MDRADATGFGVAAAGHLALFVALSLGFATARLPVPKNDPIEVELVDEVGLASTAPAPSAEAPAPLLAAEEGPPMPAPAIPAPPQVLPVRAPKPAARAAPPKPSPPPARPEPAANPPQTRSTGRLSGLLTGVSERESDRSSATPPAAAAGPAVEASLQAEVRRQLKPHWKSPSGADAELLRTELSIWLARDGSITRVEVIRTTGQTPSNRPQVKLHQEQALRAVRLAAPFNLPDKFYDAWKYLSPIGFDRKLSR